MFKTFALSTVLSAAANGTAAIAGTVTAVQVLRGKSPTTAATVTLAAAGTSILCAGVAMAQARRINKALAAVAAAAEDE